MGLAGAPCSLPPPLAHGGTGIFAVAYYYFSCLGLLRGDFQICSDHSFWIGARSQQTFPIAWLAEHPSQFCYLFETFRITTDTATIRVAERPMTVNDGPAARSSTS